MAPVARLGIFGGTFNPPHVAHLIGAQLALEQLALDRLLFIPTNIPPHKSDHDIAEPEHRLAMTRLAVNDNPLFDVSDIEIRREGKSYTIDTIRELRRQYGSANLYLLIGLDMLTIFDSWKDHDAILQETTIVVMLRPGNRIEEIPETLRTRVTLLEMPQLDISSTAIRKRVAAGLPVRYYVPDDVGAYIARHSLYKD